MRASRRFRALHRGGVLLSERSDRTRDRFDHRFDGGLGSIVVDQCLTVLE